MMTCDADGHDSSRTAGRLWELTVDAMRLFLARDVGEGFEVHLMVLKKELVEVHSRAEEQGYESDRGDGGRCDKANASEQQ